jgi:hypothetical protein
MTNDIDGNHIAPAIILATASLDEITSRVEEARWLRHDWNTRWKPGGEVKLSATEQAAIINGLGVLQRSFIDDDAELADMLGKWVTLEQVFDLVGLLAPAYPTKAQGYVGALYAALVIKKTTEDVGVTGRDRRVPISVEMVADTISRYFIDGTDTGYMPLPDAFRKDCLASRGRVEALRGRVRGLMAEPMPALPQIEYRPLVPVEPMSDDAKWKEFVDAVQAADNEVGFR